ncbi:PNK3P-domain-containing protein [Gloeophyllum trabeum ATCC 11539]|uniref:PNK3P-domain-containing protein n=1 Tax=Gloeophyllum trabeum (strain ATCC 11539 / FP-39264 / Madison 617) TaxID=670483 RepID=S7QIJ5_GLOTA|nr:PNK3P-domain-containing protein [Gloeophyllum trabeum ATCC 11539]EPQ59072.1 PNK3P-domain-containing protein [Gloeophyllum trabeum ATCC 11539]
MNLNPPSLAKVAAFDLDGTIIKSSFGKGKATKKAGPTYEWWRPLVPKRLREVSNQGFAIIIISNQNLKSVQLAEWKKKIPLIAAALPDVPFHLFAATAKDGYRKPMPGMWYELEKIFDADGVKIDKSASFYVGDAAGRAGDFASTDRKWAINVGIPFFTPEEYFLGLQAAPYKLPGFHVSSLPSLPSISPTSKPILPDPNDGAKPEVVLFVGYPSLGKSTFYKRHFQPAGYVHVNQDTLGSRPKCVKAVEEALEKGLSCIVDNTNRDRQTRKYYVDAAKRLGATVRCFLFQGSMELAWHNNLYRAYNMPPSQAEKESRRDLVPYAACLSFRDNYEEPREDEGFTEVRIVNWIFEGDEEELRRWSMWLQIDGK